MKKSGILASFIERFFRRVGTMIIERQLSTIVSISTESIDALEVRLSIALDNLRESTNSKSRRRAYVYARLIAAVGYARFGDDWKTVVLNEVQPGESHETSSQVWRYGT